MSSLELSRLDISTRVKSMSSLESSQCLHLGQVSDFTRVKSVTSLDSSQCLH